MVDRIHSIKYAVVPSIVRAACPVHVTALVARVARLVRHPAQAAVVAAGLMAVGALTMTASGILGPTVVRGISHVRREHTGMVHRVPHAPPAIIAKVFLVCPKAVCPTDTAGVIVVLPTHTRTAGQLTRTCVTKPRQILVHSSMAAHRQIVAV